MDGQAKGYACLAEIIEKVVQVGQSSCTSAPSSFESWAEDVNFCDDPELLSRNDELNITCWEGKNCRSNTNTTFCAYEGANYGHFEKNFETNFPNVMSREIAHFFAKDVCENKNDGEWSRDDKVCYCQNQTRSGLYCFGGESILTGLSTNSADTDVMPTSSPTSILTVITPTTSPTVSATYSPTSPPTALPTASATYSPTSDPTALPTATSTTYSPTSAPTSLPTATTTTYLPTSAPTSLPTVSATNTTLSTISSYAGLSHGTNTLIENMHTSISMMPQYFFIVIVFPLLLLFFYRMRRMIRTYR